MNEPHPYAPPIIESILHPTDFSQGSQVAFHHALKAALLAKSKLSLLHVSPDATFPGCVRPSNDGGFCPRVVPVRPCRSLASMSKRSSRATATP
jgi:hypothetical protein